MNRPSNTFDIAIEQAFDFLSPEYAELFDSSAATAFQHPLWLDTLYTRLASHAAATPLVVVVRHRATGALAMVLPLLRIRRGPIRTVEFADLRVSDYLAPVCSPKVFSQLIEGLHLNADSRLIHALVLKVDALQPNSVRLAGLVSLGYAGMLLVEGVGLWLEFTWAAYLTVVSTSLLLPFELYEVIEQVSVLRIGVLLLNLAIVAYLISQLRRHTLRSRT